MEGLRCDGVRFVEFRAFWCHIHTHVLSCLLLAQSHLTCLRPVIQLETEELLEFKLLLSFHFLDLRSQRTGKITGKRQSLLESSLLADFFFLVCSHICRGLGLPRTRITSVENGDEQRGQEQHTNFFGDSIVGKDPLPLSLARVRACS